MKPSLKRRGRARSIPNKSPKVSTGNSDCSSYSDDSEFTSEESGLRYWDSAVNPSMKRKARPHSIPSKKPKVSAGSSHSDNSDILAEELSLGSWDSAFNPSLKCTRRPSSIPNKIPQVSTGDSESGSHSDDSDTLLEELSLDSWDRAFNSSCCETSVDFSLPNQPVSRVDQDLSVPPMIGVPINLVLSEKTEVAKKADHSLDAESLDSVHNLKELQDSLAQLEDECFRMQQENEEIERRLSQMKNKLKSPENNKHLEGTMTFKLGDRVAVFWNNFNRYFNGVINSERPKSAECFRILYDDGDIEWINPKRQRIVLLQRPSPQEKNIESNAAASNAVSQEENTTSMKTTEVGDEISSYSIGTIQGGSIKSTQTDDKTDAIHNDLEADAANDDPKSSDERARSSLVCELELPSLVCELESFANPKRSAPKCDMTVLFDTCMMGMNKNIITPCPTSPDSSLQGDNDNLLTDIKMDGEMNNAMNSCNAAKSIELRRRLTQYSLSDFSSDVLCC